MISKRRKDKPIFLTWLMPGLEIKRWMFLTFTGTVLTALGATILLELHPVYHIIEFIKSLARASHSEITGSIILILGLIFFLWGWKRTNSSIITAVKPDAHLLENLYVQRKLSKGPKIVAIGGGTGLSTILKGLKHITGNITAVVTVGDDGGSSGRLREEMGILPPGDIRNCIAGLANEESLVTELFQYRFKSGNGLEGHSFGNLFLSALCAITGDMVTAVKESSKVLSIRGRVLPSTLDDMKLLAELEDGRIIYGESNIPEANGKIVKLKATPEKLKALDEVIMAINEADIIIMGPGSLYTSVIPNILIDEISEAISKSEAKKLYICNIMTQPGETDDYTVSDHIKAIMEHTNYKNIIDTVLVNDSLPNNLAAKYKAAESYPVVLDSEKLKEYGLKILTKRLIEENSEGLVRHSPGRIARIISDWFKINQRKNGKLDSVEKKAESIEDKILL